jgi:hypothetical protein
MKDVFEEAEISVTPKNKRGVDQATHKLSDKEASHAGQTF